MLILGFYGRSCRNESQGTDRSSKFESQILMVAHYVAVIARIPPAAPAIEWIAESLILLGEEQHGGAKDRRARNGTGRNERRSHSGLSLCCVGTS